jgi:putative ATPase
MSRSTAYEFRPLARVDLEKIFDHTTQDKDRGLGGYDASVTPEAREHFINSSSGDARRLLNALELAFTTTPANEDGRVVIDLPVAEASAQKRSVRYDKSGDEHYDTISAFIKSMRASNVDAALYYLARMVEAGEDALFIARRMVIFASEDVGMAQPTALVVANEVFKACEVIGYPECQINLAHGVSYLCKAPKDRSSYEAYFSALSDVKEYGNLPIPLKLRNAPTKLMKGLGYGTGYEMYGDGELLPEKLQGKKYFH